MNQPLKILKGYVRLAYLLAYSENDLWDKLLTRLGSFELERRMSKMTSYREYARRYPFDGGTTNIPLETVEDYIQAGGPSPEERLIMQQAQEEFLDSLTYKQREVAEGLNAGYKPREIAQTQGEEDSGRIRWHKHVIKEKLKRRKL